LDQPTGGLDPIATTFIENLIIKLKRKFTIIIISHSMSQTQRISDKTFFMLNGKIIEQGTTKQIFMNPKQKATKDFVLGR
jgi:phosphate transport system ATP-binding protein